MSVLIQTNLSTVINTNTGDMDIIKKSFSSERVPLLIRKVVSSNLIILHRCSVFNKFPFYLYSLAINGGGIHYNSWMFRHFRERICNYVDELLYETETQICTTAIVVKWGRENGERPYGKYKKTSTGGRFSYWLYVQYCTYRTEHYCIA